MFSTADFIKRAKLIHGNKYDYSKTNHINSKTKLCIICPKHKEFWTLPHNHLKGQGCPNCYNEIRGIKSKISKKFFIDSCNKIHNNKYKYDINTFNGMTSRIKIKCPIHGLFFKIAYAHLTSKQGCQKCSYESQLKPLSSFITESNKIHNNKYKYNNFIYLGAFKKSYITCYIHGDFLQDPHSHLKGHGCPKCNSSKGELVVEQYLKEHNIKFKRQYKFKDCKDKKPLPFDFYLPNFNICIEYDGEQHFGKWFTKIKIDFNIIKLHDNIKNEYCKNNNIKLIRIPYTKINKINTILSNIMNY